MLEIKNRVFKIGEKIKDLYMTSVYISENDKVKKKWEEIYYTYSWDKTNDFMVRAKMSTTIEAHNMFNANVKSTLDS